MFNNHKPSGSNLGSTIIRVFIEISVAFITFSIIAKFTLLIYGLISGIIYELDIFTLIIISITSFIVVACTKNFIPNRDKGKNLLKVSWEKGQPEYPMFILSGIVGIGLATGYYKLFCTANTNMSLPSLLTTSSPKYSLYAGLLTVFASPFLLVTWKWRNTNKHIEFANKQKELDTQHRLANEELLRQSGGQLGHEKDAVRLCGLQGIDRYARIMMENARPEYGEFQRAINILCSYSRQICSTQVGKQKQADKRKQTESSSKQIAYLFDTYPEDYESCILIINKLLLNYHKTLKECIENTSQNENISNSISLPLVDLRKCDLHHFTFPMGILLTSSILSKANLKWADLEGANLKGAALNGADLTRANLTRANLTGANLTGANLTGANLKGANLKGAELNGADLNGADLTGADLKGADLTGANLTGANLTGANLTGANLTGYNLTGYNLTGANLTYANLTYANLTYANLTYANLEGANLEGANLEGANLVGANLKRANLIGVTLIGASLLETDLSETKLVKADLSTANLTQSTLYRADLKNADLHRASLKEANLTYANLTYTNLTYASILGTDLTGTDLTGADLTGADLTGADLTGANLTGANLSYAFILGTDLTGTDLTGTDLTGANLTGANLTGTSLTGTIITGTKGLNRYT